MADNKETIKRYFDDFRECLHDVIVQQFAKTGDDAVKVARNPHDKDWTDRTGNLRSSIGFMVTYKGKQVELGGFESTAAPNGNGQEGTEEGERVIKGLKGTNTEGYALVIVAGMNYAEYVQAHENRDVLASAESFARDEIKKNLSIVPQLVEQKMKAKGW